MQISPSTNADATEVKHADAASTVAKPAKPKRPGGGGRSLNGLFVQVRWRLVPISKIESGKELSLTMAVAKKLLPRAIDRNRFRRVTREAWRARQTLTTSMPSERPMSIAVFVRLMKKSPDWKTMPDGQLKRAWRAEIDTLFESVGTKT